MEETPLNLESTFDKLFETTSGTGEEELLKIATTFTRQLTAYQMKAICLIELLSQVAPEKEKEMLQAFKKEYLTLKQYNNSGNYIGRIFESLSLKRFIGDNPIKVNIEK